MNIIGLIYHHITIVLLEEFINYSVRVRKLINMVFSNKINNIGRECAACNLIFLICVLSFTILQANTRPHK